MENDNSFTSLLEDSFSDNEIVDDDGDYSSKIKDALINLRQVSDTTFLQQALQESLSSCPNNFLDEKICKEVLPLAQRLLSEALEQIGKMVNTDEDALENVNQQLSTCHELLIVLEKPMECVSKLHKMSVDNLKFLMENACVTIKTIFEHCHASTKLYGTLFEGVSEKLTNLFRKTKTILTLFLATLEGVIVFDTDTESETELLEKVIDTIGFLVSISHALDLKTFVETSKTFGKLAITYQHVVKRTKPTAVTLHLELLTKEVTSMLLLLQGSLNNADERKIKVIGHSLKILDKLFAAYCSCLSKETLMFAIELIVQMHRCNESCLKRHQVTDKVIELINAHISKGCEPLLNTVFKHFDFKQAFFDYENETSSYKLGYHLLTISIMKKLANTSYEQHCKWTLGAESIIHVALLNINSIQEEICMGDIKLPGSHDIGERPRLATLYEVTLVPICSLISQIPADGFHVIELILLKHLLSDRLWSALLSSDVWCFIGRISSSELCVSHVKYLLKVYAALMQRRNDFEVVILENLIGRLYSLLSEETRHSVVTELDDIENPSWTPIARFLPFKTKSFLQKRLACVLNEIPKTFLELQRQPTVQNWNRITTLMLLIGKLNYVGEENTVDILSEIWNSISNTTEIFEGRQLDIVSEFMWKLFSATQPEKIQDDTFYTILEAMLTSLLCLPSHVRATASHYLRDNINSFDNCGPKIANALTELNCRLLEDNNLWVRQEAFESFDYMAHMCPNEDLVTKMATAITKKSSLNDSVPAYLSSTTYYELHDFSDVRLYLQHVAKNSQNVHHVCYHYEESERNEKFAKLETELSGSSVEIQSSGNLDEHVNKICDELNDILRKTADVGDHALRRLRLLCVKILDLPKSSKET
ncbi:FIGNL1-interacting regulator of recombination and mitosis-like isoform X2 [Nomia melanderi]